jgi:hypothetical protein
MENGVNCTKIFPQQQVDDDTLGGSNIAGDEYQSKNTCPIIAQLAPLWCLAKGRKTSIVTNKNIKGFLTSFVDAGIEKL